MTFGKTCSGLQIKQMSIAWVVGRLDDGETLFVERSQFELIELGLS